MDENTGEKSDDIKRGRNVIKVTKFNCRKKLVSVTKFHENNPTGHRAKIF